MGRFWDAQNLEAVLLFFIFAAKKKKFAPMQYYGLFSVLIIKK